MAGRDVGCYAGVHTAYEAEEDFLLLADHSVFRGCGLHHQTWKGALAVGGLLCESFEAALTVNGFPDSVCMLPLVSCERNFVLIRARKQK